MSQTYTFHDFILKYEELSLYHKNKRLELGLKGFKLLNVMVQNHGKLVTKDDLIIAAWDNQIVTDGTLSKQVERIRHVLGSIHPEIEFIETVRGIGYKFIPTVRSYKNRKKGLAKWQKAIASASIIPLVLFIYFYPFGQKTDEILEKPIMPFNIAVIPAVQGDDFINVGGLSYLSTLLNKNPRILSLSPKIKWFANEDIKKLAIEIEDHKKLDYILLVKLSETASGKIAELKLKNNNQFRKIATVNALSYKQLFANVNTWVRQQLQLKNQDRYESYNSNLSDDSFALESFLRGLKESNIRNYTKAIQYFQMAVTQDKSFDLARLRTAESQILSGDYAPAQALLDTMESNTNLHENLRLFLLALKSSILIYTEEPLKAAELIQQSIDLATKQNDTRVLELALYLKSTMYLQLGNLPKAIESTLKQAELLKLTSKDLTELDRIANNLGFLYYSNNQFSQALIQINKAVKGYENSGSVAGRLSSYDILAKILYELAKYSEAKVAIDKALPLLEQTENKRLKLGFLESQAYVQIEIGLHKDVKETISSIEKLALLLKTTEPKILALGAKLDLATRKNKQLEIKILYERFLLLANEIEQNLPVIRQFMEVKLIAANLALGQLEQAKIQIRTLQSSLAQNQPQLQLFTKALNVQWDYKAGNLESAQIQLKILLQQALDKQHYRVSLEFAYLLINIAIEQNNYQQVQAIINKIEFINPFPYPYLKYKAMLAANTGNYFEASTLMQEMKNTSNDWWGTDDQILLDSYFAKINEKHK